MDWKMQVILCACLRTQLKDRALCEIDACSLVDRGDCWQAFRKERAKKLLADMSQADEIEKSYATVSDDIMQPSQLINAARANQGEGDKVFACVFFEHECT
jgi:hypothetical protein